MHEDLLVYTGPETVYSVVFSSAEACDFVTDSPHFVEIFKIG
jgi:hypothetical protein